MIKALDEDNGKRTMPPLPLLEAIAEVFIADKRQLLRLTAFEFEMSFRVFSRKREVVKMVVIEDFVEVCVVDERESLRYGVVVIIRGEI
jgi:hypothetical protein